MRQRRVRYRRVAAAKLLRSCSHLYSADVQAFLLREAYIRIADLAVERWLDGWITGWYGMVWYGMV